MMPDQGRYDQKRHNQQEAENYRHAQELQRHRNESDREWPNRQARENQRHESAMNNIERQHRDSQKGYYIEWQREENERHEREGGVIMKVTGIGMNVMKGKINVITMQ